MLEALQLEHSVLLTCTEISLAEVAPQTLLLETETLKLHENAPTCAKLMEPPFAPKAVPLILTLKALQLEHADLLTCTEISLAVVILQTLLLEESKLKLQEYAPTCAKLMEPPYEFAP